MKAIDALLTIVYAAVIVFGLFIAYQLIRKILGGSWGTEDIITAMVIANITVTFGLAINTTKGITKINSELSHLRKQFNSLATDFKAHIKDHKRH